MNNYSFHLVYIPGKHLGSANRLGRLPLLDGKDTQVIYGEVLVIGNVPEQMMLMMNS